jgi:lipoate---protein ligase
MEWLWVPHLKISGIEQMALDRALLDWVQQTRDVPRLIVRTYEWNTPTLSLGVHQQPKDIQKACRFYEISREIVRRPTGGRAILHGKDISFAFVTNQPTILKMTLDQSYCYFMTWVRLALEASGVAFMPSCQTDKTAYMRSPLCFETQTPSDLLGTDGQKIAGSAQLRQHRGILQHGATFLERYHVDAETFEMALKATIAQALQQEALMLDPKAEEILNRLWQRSQEDYARDVEAILDKLAMTSGSHLLPASD